MASKLNILFFSLEEYHKWSLSSSHTVQFSCSVMSDSLWTPGLQHARPPCPSPPPRVYPNSSPLSRWCHPTISSSVIPFSSCLRSFPASGSFQMSQFFASGAKVLEWGAIATWGWVNSESWCWTGRPGMLQSMGSQRVGHDWVTELNWTEWLIHVEVLQKTTKFYKAIILQLK